MQPQQAEQRIGRVQKVSPYLELILAYCQYLGLIYQIDVTWPSLWDTFLGWVSISTLAAEFNLTGNGNHAVIDARAHFLMITVLLPLALSFLMLIFAKPWYIITWFFVLLLGFGLLAAGVALFLLGIPGNAKVLLGAGAACVVVCGVIYLLRLFANRTDWSHKAEKLKQALRARREEQKRKLAEAEGRRGSTDSNDENGSGNGGGAAIGFADSPGPVRKPLIHHHHHIKVLPKPALEELQNITNRVLDQEKEEEKEAFENAHKYKEEHNKVKGPGYFCVRFLVVLILGFGGIVIWGYFQQIPVSVPIPVFSSMRNIFGPILVGMAGILLVYLILNVTKSGHVKVQSFKTFLEARFVWIMIFALTLLYIPFTSTALGGLRCVTLDCKQGYQAPVVRRLDIDSAIAQTYSSLTSGCDACNFVGNCSIAASLCRPSTAKRLVIDLSQPCDVNIMWMIPVAVITGFVITLGTPFLFYRLVVKHTRLLAHIPAEGNQAEKWDIWCTTTRNSAKNLYYGFTYKWRFYRMFLILQRLALLLATIFLFQEPRYLIYFTLFVHAFFFLFNLLVRPYRNLGIDGIAFGTGAGLVATCALGVTIVWQGEVGTFIAIWLIIIDVLTPSVSTGFMMWLQQRRLSRKVAPKEPTGMELGPKAQAWEEEREKELEKERKARPLDVVDIIINEFTLKTMSNFFIVVGILAFLSLAVGIVGVLHSNTNLNVEAPVLSDNSAAATQFVGYTSWAEFTENCCCQYANSIETWKCLNGLYKERLRETTGSHKISGLSLRAACSYEFSTSVCQIPSTETNFKAVMCDGYSAEDYAKKYLW